jgi:predicted CXXCH cytochrome family protein
MKQRTLFIILAIAIVLSSGMANAAVFPLDGTKHDLSPAGPGPSKAISVDPTQGGTSEICIFCHTPHSGNTEAPLWNRASSAATYQTYTSDVLGGLGYWGTEDPRTGVPHSKTRICLSCHDGTIALGSVVNMPNDIPTAYSQIQMVGNSTIQPSSQGYIGIQLQDDHPVAIKHDRVRDLELVSGSSIGGGVRLYKDGAGKAVIENADGNYVECTSCHNVHDNVNGNFLVEPNTGSALCKRCHTKTGFEPTSIHFTATDPYAPPDGKGGSLSLNNQVGGVQCMICHFPHKAGITDTGSLPAANPNLSANPKAGYYLLAFQEELSCFNNTNRWNQNVTVCHGSNAGAYPNRNIQTVENSNAALGRRHWTQDPGTVGRHEVTEGKSAGWINVGGSLAKWHVECADCHNSHTSGGQNHAVGTNAIPTSSPLYGTGGVSMPGSPRTWAGLPGNGYTYREPLGVVNTANTSVQYEYEICFKCHTDFAWGAGTVPSSPSLGSFLTDQAMELSAANASYHPVVGANTVNNQGTYVGGWTSGSTQTMYCSDCHTLDNGNRPLGPHGSGNSFILKKPYTDAYGAINQTQPVGDVCFDCHDSGTYLNGTTNPGSQVTGFYTTAGTNLHTRHYQLSTGGTATGSFGYRCVNCHARIPHGYTRKALIVQRNEGAPYEAGGTGQGKISAAPLTASGNYQTTKTTTDCTTVAGCHN